MLEFNPYFRPSAEELLRNPIFDHIRQPNLERMASEKLTIESVEDNYGSQGKELSAKQERQLINKAKVGLVNELLQLKEQGQNYRITTINE